MKKNKAEIKSKVLECLKKCVNVSALRFLETQKGREDTLSFSQDLGMDAFDMIFFSTSLEDEFPILVEWGELKTIGQTVDLIFKRL